MAKNAQKSIHHAWWIMVSCCAMMITAIGINGTVQSIFLKPVSDSLGCGIGELSLYITIRSLVSTAFIPIAAKLTLKYDLRMVLSMAFAVQGLCLASMGSFTSLYQFYIFGGIGGAASAFVFFLPVPMLISHWFSAKTGTVLGISMAFSGVGGAIFTPLGSYIIQTFGWRTAYPFLGFAGIAITLPFTLFVIRRTPAEKGLLPYGQTAKTNETAAPKELAGIMAKDALKMPAFYLVAFFALAVNLTGAIVMHLPNLTQSKGFSFTSAAIATSFFTVGIIFGKLALGYLSDRIGTRNAIVCIASVGILSIVIMFFNSRIVSLHFFGTFCLGVCTSLATLGAPLAVPARFGMKDYTTIFSYISTVCALASAFGTTVYGFVYDKTGSYNFNLIFLGFVLILGILALFLAFKSIPSQANTPS